MQDTPRNTADTSLIAAVGWLAAHHGQPFTETALRARLPQGFEMAGPDAAVRALDATGLKARPLDRPVTRIDTGSLPALIFEKEGRARLLLGLDTRADTAEIYDPVTRDAKTLSAAQLRALTQQTLLVAPKEAVVTSRLSPDAVAIDPEQNHWLWSELRRHKGAWAQVALAALGVNLAGLALPIFVMNVYDRVIPNLAMVTLWTLALGVAIALILDMLLKVLRTSVLERAGRRIDLKVASSLFQQALSVKLLKREGSAASLASQIRDFEAVREFFSSLSFVALIDLTRKD